MPLDLEKLRDQTDPLGARLAQIAKGCEEQINAQDQEHEQGDFGDTQSRADRILGAILLALDVEDEAREETNAEVEKALQTVILWTTDWDKTAASKRVTIIAGLREFCRDALRRMRGERAQTPEERIVYLERALGSIAHTCANNEKPGDIPWLVRGIVERAIRGLPNPISAVGSDKPEGGPNV